jgi:hypothetical protein
MADAFEDLGAKIGTEEEKFWTDLLKNTQKAQEHCKHETVINETLAKLCEYKIKEEKEKFK